MNIPLENKETHLEKKRTITLLVRILSDALLILFVGFLMYAILLAIMYFI